MEILNRILHKQGAKVQTQLAQDRVLWRLWYERFQPTGYISIHRLIYCHLIPKDGIFIIKYVIPFLQTWRNDVYSLESRGQCLPARPHTSNA
jgi:hypothetical protein